MNTEILAYLNRLFTEIGIDYSFMRKNGKPKYPYFVGEYIESPEANESGEEKVTFTLNGWTNGQWSDLETVKNNIAVSLRNHTAIVKGYGVAIYYNNSTPISTEDYELKRMQIILDIRIWRNN